MALLFLSPHEGRLVRFGRDTDHTWKPRPGSAEERAIEADWYTEVEENRDGDALRNIFDARTRRDGGPHLDVNANSTYWRTHTRTHGFLVTQERGGQVVIGIANCMTKSRAGWRGSAVLRLSDWWTFTDPVPVEGLIDRVPHRMRHVVRRIFADGDSRLLPATTLNVITDAIETWVPAVRELLASLPPFPVVRRVPTEKLPQRDAEQSALRIFTPTWRELTPIPSPPPPTPLATHTETLVSRLQPTRRPREDEVITADTSRFLDWDPEGHAFNGWFLFRSGDRQLLVKNINYSPEETSTGADLVYVRSEPNSVVLVQYKLLEALQGSNDYFFRDRDDKLAAQVMQMLALSASEAQSAPPADAVPDDPIDGTGADDYRLGPDIGFVKFVEPVQPRRSGDRLSLPAGRYFPARGVLRMLQNPSKGPRGGDIHRVHSWRSLDGETFAKLVRDQWVGSAGDVTGELFDILGLDDAGGVCLAIEEPTQLPRRP